MTNYIKKTGDIGLGVNKLQGYLNLLQKSGLITRRATQDGIFGIDTKNVVLEWQGKNKEAADGIVHERTWDSVMQQITKLKVTPFIPSASKSYVLSIGVRGLDVYKIQEYLNVVASHISGMRNINVDGIYGKETKQAVSIFQYNQGLHVDGMLGATTWDAIICVYLQYQ